MPRPHRFMLHSPVQQRCSRSASPFKTPSRSQVYTFSTSDQVRDVLSSSSSGKLLVVVLALVEVLVSALCSKLLISPKVKVPIKKVIKA
ncbi:hypothetical protein BASA50_010754 [Batrachochytrium salamandrivorans]|uniref:Uncharacterized protein n=1 Tax=Batrachochytrium salamandrivorans TaxID=1357716 RepID=A0ABQ8F0R6_9FUNG|nr:hypothetical protein BASA50_010754 [Batrachochytrium salamandrivorans]